MDESAPPEEGLRGPISLRHRRTSLFITAALVATLSLAEPAYRTVSPALALVHVAWVALLLGSGALVPAVSARAVAALLSLSAVGNVLLYWAGVHATGGFASPDFEYVSVMPLALAMVFQDELGATLAGSAALTACLAFDGRMEDGGWLDALATTTAMGALAAFGSWSFRRVRLAELAHQRDLALSERRRAQAERLAQLGQLSAGVAHELGNPLAYVMLSLQLLEESTAPGAPALDPDEARSLLADLRHGVTRLTEIVGDLKAHARGDARDVEDCAVDDVVRDAMRLASMRVGKRVEVRVELDAGLPKVRGKPRRLSQVLLNLLANAADALEAAAVERPHVVVRAHVEGDEVCMTVEDNGPGVPPEIAGRLFEAFVTTKPDGAGTGLGLSLAREHLAEHGGRIELAPSDAGARFAIHLPLATREAATVDERLS